MLYESCGCPGGRLGAPLVSQGCFAGVLRLSPVIAIRAVMQTRLLPAFSLQRIFPAMPCARLAPLRSAVGRKGLHSRLAGGIFEKIAKHGPPITDSTEVASTKRIPYPNYSLSIAVPGKCSTSHVVAPGTPRSASGEPGLLRRRPAP